MTVSGLFQYPEGRGWIVLSGGADAGSMIRAQVLRRARAEGGTAYLVMRDDDADATLDDMDDLGARRAIRSTFRRRTTPRFAI